MLPSRQDDNICNNSDNIYNVGDDTDEDDEVYSSDFDDDEEEGEYVDRSSMMKK